jgi:hypothetical protein
MRSLADKTRQLIRRWRGQTTAQQIAAPSGKQSHRSHHHRPGPTQSQHRHHQHSQRQEGRKAAATPNASRSQSRESSKQRLTKDDGRGSRDQLFSSQEQPIKAPKMLQSRQPSAPQKLREIKAQHTRPQRAELQNVPIDF